jgi:peptide/nickel transport system substrate-binding protein
MDTSKRSWSPRGRRTSTSPASTTLAVIVTIGLLAAACGDDSGGDDASGDETAGNDAFDDPRWANVEVGPEASDDEPATGGSLTVSITEEPPSFLPSEWRSGDYNAAYAIFDPLVARTADGTLEPYLAESVEPNETLDEWTVTLRPDVEFHDGTPLTAEAVKRAFDDYLVGGTVSSQFGDIVEGLEVQDELTVTYVLTEPHAQFMDLLVLPLGWPFSPDAADDLGEDFAEQPVGTGPFKLVSWQRGNEIVLERNEDYWQEGRPYLDEITFRNLPDDAARAQSLESRDVDAVQGISISPLAVDVADIEGVRLVLGPTNNARGMMFNTGEPPTDDVRVRQALAHAADQEPLLEVAADEAAALTEVRTQLFPSDSPFYSEAVADAWPTYDPGEAERLLGEYVDDPDRSDGKAAGEPVEIALTVVNRPAAIELATAYEGAYDDVGFDASVDPVEDIAPAVFGRAFQGVVFSMLDDRSPLGELQVHFGDGLITNYTDFHDDTVAGAIEELRTVEDPDRQVEISEEVGLHLAEQMPVHWLASSLTYFAADESVRGLRSWELPDGTLGDGTRRAQTMWGQVWVDD